MASAVGWEAQLRRMRNYQVFLNVGLRILLFTDTCKGEGKNNCIDYQQFNTVFSVEVYRRHHYAQSLAGDCAGKKTNHFILLLKFSYVHITFLTRLTMHWPIVLKTVFAIIMIVCMYYIFISKEVNELRKIYKLKHLGVKVKGEIFDNYSFDIDGTQGYYPLITFTTKDKESYRIIIKVPKSQPWLIGEKVELIYDPQNPNDAVLNKSSLLFSIYFFLFFCAIMIILFVLAVIFGSPSPASTPIYP